MIKAIDRLMAKSARNRWIASALVVIALMAALFWTGHVIFQTNDDSTIVGVAAGYITGENEPSNGITGYLYGLLLSLLYGAMPTVPWHASIMLSLQAISLMCVLKSFITVCVRREKSCLWGLFAFLGLTVAVYAPYFYELQFTAAPAIIASGAFCLLLTHEKRSPRETVLAIFLAAFGMLIRKDALLLALPALLIPALLEIFRGGEARRKLVLRVGVTALILAAIYVSDAYLYERNNAGWAEYQAFENETTRLMDFGAGEEALAAASADEGWPKELTRMVSGWFFLDERMDTETLARINDTLAARKESPSLWSVIRATGSVVKEYPVYQLNYALFAMCSLFLFIDAVRRRQGWLLLISVGLVACSALVIAYFYGVLGRFPERVAFASICPIYAVTALLALDTEKARGTKRAAALALAAGMAACAVYGAVKVEVPSAVTRSASLTSRVNAYAQKHRELLYVTNIPQDYDPFQTAPRGACQNVLFWGHGLTGSPALVGQQRLNGYEALSSKDFFDDNVRVLVSSEGAMEALMEYMRIGEPDASYEADGEGVGFLVYRLVR